MRIVITGAKHSGKTTIAKRLAGLFCVPSYDTDDALEQLFKRKHGKSLSVRQIHAQLGESGFRALEKEACCDLFSRDWCVISTGGGAALDPSIRQTIYSGSVLVHLCADEALLWKRIELNGIPSFYQGEGGRDKHKARVLTIDEVMTPRADIVFAVTESNQETAHNGIAALIEKFMMMRMSSPNSFGEIVRVTTFGESHGRGLGAVLDGVAPGLSLNEDEIQTELDRRRPGQSDVATPRNEKDRVKILSGVFEGKTTGTPVCMVVFNEDQDSTKYEALRDVFRPGHADFTFWKKFGVRDHRGGGRSSGRETIGRVCSGAVAKKILLERGVTLTAFAEEIAGIKGESEDFAVIEKNSVRAADLEAAALMEKAILDAREGHDSVGGIVKLVIRGIPAGLGDPVFFKLDARLAQAFVSLGSVKGIEFGSGFAVARVKGSRNNDPVTGSGFESNNAGGILGGISNGDEIIVRLAVKPTPSIFLPQQTTDLNGNSRQIEIKGRHDPCIVPRIIPVVESMAALVLLDAWEIQSRIVCSAERSMKIFRSFEDASAVHSPVVTVGNFDGVHLGHRTIFTAMKELSASLNTQSLVLSFAAHPRSVLYPEHRLPVITTLDERLAAIEECGIDAVLLINFTKETAALSASEFVERFIIERFGASHMVIGYDHAFGKNREGNIDFLLSLGSRCGFGVTQVKPYLCDGHPVSSSRIRDEIEAGDVSDAARYLGRNYSLSGVVVEGLKRGRKMGFPTANISTFDPGKVVPADGVYATLAHLPDGTVHQSVTNIGSNPTFGDVPRTVETHLFDFNGDLYGRPLAVEFAARIRGEVRFSSVQELTEAIRLDCDEAARILSLP